MTKSFSIEELRELVLTGQTRTEKWRRLQLERIQNILDNHEEEILEALNKDLRKPPTEAFFEIIALTQELKLTKANLSQWMRSKRIQVPLSFKPAEAIIQPEPLGCILIIGPWNYPFSLTIQPLISALAAGNTAVLKPSEHAKATSNLIERLISKYFPKNVIQVIQGDGSVAENLLKKNFDHIFFTGGSKIGKKVMMSAAKYLTPITLELGGKSPAIVLEGADIGVTAKRIIWGKGLNSGQTCIAPDHLIVKKELKRPLLKEMKRTIIDFYGATPLESPHLSKIINPNQFTRLKELLDRAKAKEQVFYGGEIDSNKQLISPTLINIENRDDPLMAEELFGPLLPILSIENLDKTIVEIRCQPKPLAIYIFGGSEEEQNQILSTTSSGGVCINDVVMQAGIPDLPFGGVGSSGFGKYHGKAGFETFSHQKSILKRPFWLDLNFRYPPYKLDLSLLKKLLR